MRRFFARSLCLALAVAALGLSVPAAQADELERIKARGKIIIGIKDDYRPFGYLDEAGKIEGFDIDLAKFIAKEITGSDSALELVPVVAANRIELLNQGRIDIIIATLGRNADRAKVIDFTRDYYMMGDAVILAPKGTPIKAWEDLKGRKICGIQGNALNRTLSEKYGADTMLFQGSAEMFKAFQDSRCEAIGFDAPPLEQKVNEPGWKDKYIIALPAQSLYPIAAGIRKGDPAFLAAVNQAILAAEAAGLLVDGEEKYHMGHSDFVTREAAAAKKPAN